MFRQFPATTDDFHRLARRRLPRFLYDYYAGGAGRERTLAANADDWDGVKLRQRVLVDVEQIDTTTTMAGEDFAMPLAPRADRPGRNGSAPRRTQGAECGRGRRGRVHALDGGHLRHRRAG